MVSHATTRLLKPAIWALAVIGTALTVSSSAHAGDLALGQLLVGDQVLGLSGTCGRGLTHVDPTTGEQFPLTIRLLTSRATAFDSGDVVTLARSGTDLELIRITPSTGAHRLTLLEDNDFTNPNDIVEDANGDYVIINDGAVGRLERSTGIFEILASGGDLVDPTGLAVAENGDIFIADPGAGTVFRFRSTTGIAPFASGGMLSQPFALDFAANGDLLIADGKSIVRIDPLTATQASFGAALEPSSGSIVDLTVDAAGRVFILQDRPRCDGQLLQSGILRIPDVDPAVPILCVNTQSSPITSVLTVSAEIAGNDLIVLARHANDGAGNAEAVLRLDPDDGAIDIISIRPPSGAFAFGPDGSFFLAVHERDAIYEVDPKTGVSDNIASGGFLTDPRDLIVAEDGSFIYVLDDDSVVRINPATGSQAVVYDGSAFSSPVHIRRDRDGDFIVADLFAAELVFLDSTTFDATTISGGDLFRIVDVADPGSGDLAVIDVGPNAIIQIDPATGDQGLVGGAGYFSPASPSSILTADDGNLLVTVGGAGALGLVRIDPTDASQTIVSDLPICIGDDMEHVVVAPMADLCGEAVDPPSVRVGDDVRWPVAPVRLITASDALVVLRSAVALDSCELCVCDVNGSGAITASDALVLLQISVGVELVLACPPC